MTNPNQYVKDPSARLEYTWDWVKWLAVIADTIDVDKVTITIPDGLTAVGEPVITPTAVTQIVEGGTVDVTYKMSCQINTVGGLIDKDSIYLTITEK